jgi:hypothetical protein
MIGRPTQTTSGIAGIVSLLWFFSYEDRTPSAHSGFRHARRSAQQKAAGLRGAAAHLHFCIPPRVAEERQGHCGIIRAYTRVPSPCQSHRRQPSVGLIWLHNFADVIARAPTMMRKKFSAVELRRWARQCEKSASDPMITAREREQLLKMTTALFELARTEDWLNGIASVHRDPIIVEKESSPKTS